MAVDESSGTQSPMSERKPIRGMDHVGITVPDLDAASRFFVDAFDAKPLYDNIKRTDQPFAGAKAEAMLGVPPGTMLVIMRMMQLGNGPGIELFEMRCADQRPAARPSDFGLQHVAVYVDDIDYAIQRFVAAGGTMFSGANELLGLEKGEGNAWCYGLTPWGSVIELITYPGAKEYEGAGALRRWTPAV
jgi:catechol 2,3-dioxygenase-like lactoylglutathione lyase family enzyme